MKSKSVFLFLASVALLYLVAADRKCVRNDCTPECARENGCL